MRRLSTVVALGASSAMMVMACASSEAPQVADTRDPVWMTVLGGGDPAAMGNQDQHNGMPAAALKPPHFDNVNATALRVALGKRSLNDFQGIVDGDPAIATALNDPYVRTLMRYIVSCALSPSKEVTYTPQGGGTSYVWEGGLGLCDKWLDDNAASCRDFVSSCVVARTNGLSKRVPISMRDRELPLTLKSRVLVETQYREKGTPLDEGGKPIVSFDDCASPWPAEGDVTRSCGWTPLYVGTCVAGTSVTVSTPSAYCDGGSPVMLRACSGLYGCHKSDAPATYHAFLNNGDSVCPSSNGASVTFTCPANGPKVGTQTTGYFSLMAASQNPNPEKGIEDPLKLSQSLEMTVNGASPPSPFHYPSTEKETFTWEEGAFYGDIFAPPPQDQRRLPSNTLHDTLYACYSSIWNSPQAYLADRLCGDPNPPPGEQCFQYTPGACYPGRCSTASYETCTESQPAPGASWPHPIAVYLNNPCDLSDAKTCTVKK